MAKHLNLVGEEGNHASPEHFLQQHPELAAIDLVLPDINGVLRGKRILPSQLDKVAKEGVCLPASVFGLDITGETVEETGLGFSSGDSDRRCYLVPGSLCLAPWHDKPMGQAMLTMVDNDASPYGAEPRNVLARVVEQMQALGYTPCIAVELEFYLVDQERNEEGALQPPLTPDGRTRAAATQVYSLDDLDQFEGFLDEVNAVCQQQGIAASNAVAEYAPGQFEINLLHLPDAVKACDQAVMLKRVVKAVAAKYGYGATFMAKPHQELAGSGLHLHLSLLDGQGANRFASDESLLKQAVAGMLALMGESELLFAPHANSYRRMQPDMFVPTLPCWGYDNRTVALRIPNGSPADTRIEHRLGGADANPYLVAAAVIAGALHGLSQQLQPPAPIEGNAGDAKLEALPCRWQAAVDGFAAAEHLPAYLGSDFCQVYQQVKQAEIDRFEQQITPLELQWYQNTI
ncbi:glutamine synthetase family protein [Ferrimonas marina]|uniref:Glutamine synthetase n=1 Tax=Ferrimonas marina TaxID=299255 RepID=A0A1M5ZI88_9GAMM|nr:glutamine synthetase family protein [Ferrimonas marina]SHI23911.1 glutamine synthetase [Ferrimonas marina]